MTYDIYNDLFFTILGAVLGFFVSLIFFIESQKKCRIEYSIKTYPFSSENKEQYRSRVIIKNTGNTIIEQKNFSRHKPFTIASTKFFIATLDDKKTITSANGNIVQLQYKYNTNNLCNKIVLDIDALEIKETLVYDINHYGDIFIDAKLKGGKIYRKNNLRAAGAFIWTIFMIYLKIILVILFLTAIRLFTK